MISPILRGLLGVVALGPIAYLAWLALRPPLTWPDEPVLRWLTNSTLIAGTSTLAAAAVSSLAGFAVARYRFAGRRVLLAVLLATVLLPGHALLPGLAGLAQSAGLVNSPLAVILPGSVTAFGVFLYATAFARQSKSHLEAATLDGCGPLALWWRHALPLARPTTAAFLLLHFLATWNALLWPAAVLLRDDTLTLPIGLQLMASQATYEARPELVARVTLLAVAVPGLWFVLCERDFSRGLVH